MRMVALAGARDDESEEDEDGVASAIMNQPYERRPRPTNGRGLISNNENPGTGPDSATVVPVLLRLSTDRREIATGTPRTTARPARHRRRCARRCRICGRAVDLGVE